MTTLTRAEKRAHKKALRRHHKGFLKNGLPRVGNRELGASLALYFRDQLTVSRDPDRVLTAVQQAHKVFQVTDANNTQNAKLPCGAGCHFCCFTHVSVLAPEALLIAQRYLHDRRTTREDAARIFADAVVPHSSSEVVNYDPHIGPCPLLVDRRCSIYTYRPIMCRRHASHSREACELDFNGEKTDIPADREKREIGEACLVAFEAALKSVGLPHHTYDLRRSVAVVLETENALERWAGGEDILSSIESDGPGSPKIQSLIDEMADVIS